ncbi:MAG: hypothetical protein KKB20_27395 [Proteobacteria bacterium]|nr:hypothetical protein [Pseudomonadota bacterium]
MALQKEFLLPTGIEASYWRVSRVEVLNGVDVSKVSLELYLDAEARQNGSRPCELYDVRLAGFTLSELEAEGVNPVALAYQKIKAYEGDSLPVNLQDALNV